MKTNRLILTTSLLLFLGTSSASAQDKARVYCRNGSIVSGYVISLTESHVKIDPAGPIALRTFDAADVDSVVHEKGRFRLRYPLSEGDKIPKYKRRSMARGRPLKKRFTLGFYGSYRFPRVYDHTEVEDEEGNTFVFPLRVDGSMGGGCVFGGLFPIAGGMSYFEVFGDISIFNESLSIIFPGGRYEGFAMRYLAFDFGLKPMIPVIQRKTRIFFSPMVGFGFRATNLTPVGLTGGFSTGYTMGSISMFNAEWDAFFGGSLDILSSKSIATSLSAKYTYSPMYLDVDPFIAPEVRLTFSYLTGF